MRRPRPIGAGVSGLLLAIAAGIGLSGAGITAFAAPPSFSALSPLSDSCLAGRWVEVEESAPGIWTWNGETVALKGLAGAVLNVTEGGIETVHLDGAQPLIGEFHGHQIKAVLFGASSYPIRADGQHLTLGGGAVDNPVTVYYDGTPQPVSTAPYVPAGGPLFATTTTNQYRCTSTQLRIELTATNKGLGPVVDLFRRVSSAVAAAGHSRATFSSLASTVSTTLAQPSALVASPTSLFVGALITLALVLLVTFPSHLFNRTFDENHDAIREWWKRRVPRRLRSRLPLREQSDLRDALSFGAVVLVGALLAAFLDPRVGLNQRTAALFVGAVFALIAGSLLSAGSAGLYRVVRGGTGPWRLHALPSGLVVAAVCVLISRLTHFQPGYLYGLIGGIAFSRLLNPREEGHVVAISSIVTLIVAFASWFAWVPVSRFSSTHPTSFGWALASNFLAAMFVSGMVGLLIGLVPLRFLPGEKLAGWHRGVWGAVFGLAALSVIEVMLQPISSRAHVASVPFWTTAGLFIGFGTASILFWSYFRLRKGRGQPEGAPAIATPGVSRE